MNESGIYPLCNFYYIRIALKFSYTTALITAVTDCHTFGLIWDEGHTKIIAFYSPLWYHKSDKETKMCSRILRRKHRRILRRILLFLIVIYYII